jgi:hypothetical protein
VFWFSRFLQQRRERRRAIDRQAGDLLTFLGDMAYGEARSRARACRRKDDTTAPASGPRSRSRSPGARIARSGSRSPIDTRVIATSAALPALGRAADRRLHDRDRPGSGPHGNRRARRDRTAQPRSGRSQRRRACPLGLGGGHGRRRAAGCRGSSVEARAAAHEGVRQGVYPPALQTAAQALERYQAALVDAARRGRSSSGRRPRIAP